MFSKANFNKVKFQDQQLDDYILENSVLKSKLQSKIDALSIMSRELDKSSMERDRYKLLVEQLMSTRTVSLKSCVDSSNIAYRLTPTNTISGGEMLAKTQDHNNMLKLEVETLRSKLEETTGDIIVLRKQLQKQQSNNDTNGIKKLSTTLVYTNEDYEQLVNELEKIKKKYQQMQLDYRTVLDEKEELIFDRNYYKTKAQRLNHHISYILSNSNRMQDSNEIDQPKPIVDIDTLIAENKYLHESITQLQVEKEIVKRTLTKYKTLLDNRSQNYSLHVKKGFANVMTQKQVRTFLDSINSKNSFKQSSTAELKSLCLGLFEALNDKSVALQHQRKTNQILANRITELEKTLESWCNGQRYIPIFPSQMLLDEFLTDSEKSVKSNGSKEKEDPNNEKNYRNKYSDSDDDIYKENYDVSADVRKNYNEVCEYQKDGENRIISKIVLPQELEELVKEALAELKPPDCIKLTGPQSN